MVSNHGYHRGMHGASHRIARWSGPEIVAVVAITTQAPLWGTAFHLDDWPHLFFAKHLGLVEAVSSGLLGVYFRPLGQVIWFVMYQAFGLSTVAYHALLTLGTIATLILVGRTLATTGIGRLTSWTVVVVLAASPTTIVTTAWTSNLYAVFSALCGWIALSLLANRDDRHDWLIVAAVFAAACAKENGLLYAVPVALTWFRSRGWGSSRRPLAVLVSACGLFALVRALVLGGAGTPLATQGVDPTLATVALIAGFSGLALALRARHPALVVGLGLAGVFWASAAVTWFSAPPDLLAPDLRLRFCYQAVLGSSFVVAWCLDRIGGLRAHSVLAMAGIVLAGLAFLDVRAISQWRARCRDSARLVAYVVDDIRDHGASPGLVVEYGTTVETGLDPAVKLLAPGAEDTVVVRVGHVTFLAVPEPVWPAIRPRVVPAPLPGNPQSLRAWRVVFGRAPAVQWRQTSELGIAHRRLNTPSFEVTD